MGKTTIGPDGAGSLKEGWEAFLATGLALLERLPEGEQQKLQSYILLLEKAFQEGALTAAEIAASKGQVILFLDLLAYDAGYQARLDAHLKSLEVAVSA